MGRRRRHISREVVSLCLPCWQVLGRRFDGARCLACGQRLCEIRRPVFTNPVHLDVTRPTHLDAGIGSWPAAMEAAGMSWRKGTMEAAGMSRHCNGTSPKPKRPKSKLGLPDLDHSKSAVLDGLRSPESKRGYRHAIDEFIQWYCSEPRLSFNKVVVTRYRIYLEDRQLAAGTINGRLAAVRRLAYEAADAGLLSPELAASIRRVKGARKLGVRLGNWLTTDEARKLWQAPAPDTLKGKRDRAILAILLGCGLRRRELADRLVRDSWLLRPLLRVVRNRPTEKPWATV